MTKQNSWTVRVDWRRHTEIDEPELELVLDRLEGLHPAINIERTEALINPLHLSATVTLEAATLRQAATMALQAVEAAVDTKARGMEVLETEEFDRELDRPQIPALVGNADIAEMLGVSRQRAAKLDESPGFPPAVAHIKAGPLRVRNQVEKWAASWERRSGPKRKAP